MKKSILLILLMCPFLQVDGQYLKKEYPFNLSYRTNGDFNLRASISRVTDLEGATFLSVDVPSLSFSVLENPNNRSQLIYSLNPLLWLVNTTTYLLDPGPPHTTIPDLFFVFAEGLCGVKFEIKLYDELHLTFGLDHDFLLCNGSLGIRVDWPVGLKYEIDRLSIKLSHNWGSMSLHNQFDGLVERNLRIDISYSPDDNPVSYFLYYCGAQKPGNRDW